MTIVVTWSSFAVVVLRTLARALANEGSGASRVVVAARRESLPQPTRSSAREATIRARRTRRSLEMDRAHAVRARVAGRADHVDERGRSRRKWNARVHGDVPHDTRLDRKHRAIDPPDDDVVGDK